MHGKYQKITDWSKVVDVDKSVMPETQDFLRNLPLEDKSPCGLTEDEREVIVLFLSLDDLERIASYEPWRLVYELRYRIAVWAAPRNVALPPIGQFRFGPIAHAVIAHAQHELAERAKTDDTSAE